MNTELLKATSSVALILPKNLTDEVVGAALALFLFLKNEKKTVTLFSESPLPESWKNLDTSPLKLGADPLHEQALVVDAGKTPIEEIRYERDPEHNLIKIILATKNAPLKKEDVTLESVRQSADAIITVGAKNIAAIGSVWQKHPHLFYEKPVITIYPEADGETLADKTRSVMSELSSRPILPEIATALLFSLFAGTDSLKKQSPRSSALATELLACDADHRRVAEAFAKNPDLKSLQLWGRACVRSKMDDALPVLWSVLTAEDFVKTQTTPAALPFVIEQMKKSVSLPVASVFLWQHPDAKTVRSTVVSAQRNISDRVKQTEEYPNFITAEDTIRRLLRDVL